MKVKDITDAIGVAEKVYKTLFEISEVTSQEIRVKCPENIGEYSVAFNIKRGPGRRKLRKIAFEHPDILRVSIHSAPLMKPEYEAIAYTGTGIEIYLDRLSKDTEIFGGVLINSW
jgi:hypothetical protein